MAITLIPLCSIPQVASRDGHAGANAHMQLPFLGRLHFFDGSVYAFQNATIAQDPSMRTGGQTLPNIFTKDCCTCGCGNPGPEGGYVTRGGPQ